MARRQVEERAGELLSVSRRYGLRGTAQFADYTVEAVWVPRLTPSRTPLLAQRWAARAIEVAGAVPIVERPAPFPRGAQAGIRFGQVADRVEYSASFYDGFNNLPDVHVSGLDVPSGPLEIARVYPPIRTYGADAAVPLPWFTIKGEAAYFTSPSPTTDEYVLCVVQLEKQRGEWVFLGGYAGEVTTRKRAALTFAPDRGLSRSIVARASYTIDANRRVEIESAVRQNGAGLHAKAEYSQARGQHWRATVTAIVLAGERDDFIGQVAATRTSGWRSGIATDRRSHALKGSTMATQNPFGSIESAYEYVSLLREALDEAYAEIQDDTDEAQRMKGAERRVQALRLVDLKLNQLRNHMLASLIILNDLRTLRRLLLGERADEGAADGT